MFSRYLHLDSNFIAEHVLHEWPRLLTLCKELLYIISFDLNTVPKTFFDAI
jgi:hypothetical protein